MIKYKGLNLGCGEFPVKGFDNYDYMPVNKDIRFIDLNVLPLPFKDGSYDEIILNQVLEHLDVNPFMFIKEIYRILKPDGLLRIGLPSFSYMLYHNRNYHPICYMNPVIGKVNYGNVTYRNQVDFKCEKINYNFSFKRFFKRFYELFIAMGSDTINWELRKNL